MDGVRACGAVAAVGGVCMKEDVVTGRSASIVVGHTRQDESENSPCDFKFAKPVRQKELLACLLYHTPSMELVARTVTLI